MTLCQELKSLKNILEGDDLLAHSCSEKESVL